MMSDSKHRSVAGKNYRNLSRRVLHLGLPLARTCDALHDRWRTGGESSLSCIDAPPAVRWVTAAP